MAVAAGRGGGPRGLGLRVLGFGLGYDSVTRREALALQQFADWLFAW